MDDIEDLKDYTTIIIISMYLCMCVHDYVNTNVYIVILNCKYYDTTK